MVECDMIFFICNLNWWFMIWLTCFSNKTHENEKSSQNNIECKGAREQEPD